MNIFIRNIIEDDLPEVIDIQIQGWKTAYKGIIDDNFLNSMNKEKQLERRKKDYQNGHFIVAILDNNIVGFARYDDKVVSSDSDNFDSEIIALYVKPDIKGNGIGSKMINYIKDDLRKKGNKKMIIWCLKENHPSRKFYEKMGGTLTNEHNITFGDKEYPEVAFGFEL